MKFIQNLIFTALVAILVFSCKKDEFEPLCEITAEEALTEYQANFGPNGVQLAAYGFGEPRARLEVFKSKYVANRLDKVWDIWVPLASSPDAAQYPGTYNKQVICQWNIHDYTGYAKTVSGQKRKVHVIVVENLEKRTKMPARVGGNCPNVAEEAMAIISIDGEQEIKLTQFAREWNAGGTPSTCPDVSLTDGNVTYFYHMLF